MQEMIGLLVMTGGGIFLLLSYVLQLCFDFVNEKKRVEKKFDSVRGNINARRKQVSEQ